MRGIQYPAASQSNSSLEYWINRFGLAPGGACAEASQAAEVMMMQGERWA
jgi:hypothetical protein